MPRRVGGLLDETFSVYGKQFWRFVGLVAIVGAPVSLVSTIAALTVGGQAATVVSLLLTILGITYIYGACVAAVGQRYVYSAINVRSCYAEAWRRVLSLGAFAAILSLAYLAFRVLFDRSALAGFAFLAPAGAAAIYWSVALQSVMVEGYRTIGALRRSFHLVLGSWWRVLAIAVVVALVGLGLSVVVSIPFVFLLGDDLTATSSLVLLSVAEALVLVIALPVLFIAGTLVYYDLRMRKEEFDIATLSREIGAVAA